MSTRPVITVVPNPLYKKKKDSYIPLPGSIICKGGLGQPSLSVQIKSREERELARLLGRIEVFCDQCMDVSDCAWSKEMVAVERCDKVKKAMAFYIGSG